MRWHIVELFIAQVLALLLSGLLQCCFLAGLFYFMHGKLLKSRFPDFLRLSILASVPFLALYSLFKFYAIESVFSTFIPAIVHFIFFFRSIPALVEYKGLGQDQPFQ